jgi:hypothetical protein
MICGGSARKAECYYQTKGHENEPTYVDGRDSRGMVE